MTTTTASTVFPPTSPTRSSSRASRRRLQRRPVPRARRSSRRPSSPTRRPRPACPPSGGGTVQRPDRPRPGRGLGRPRAVLHPDLRRLLRRRRVDDGDVQHCGAPFTGRLGSKTAQYVGFWSSADFWIANRDQILADQVKIFVRGVNDAPRPNCCDDPLVASRGFTEAEHDWMTEYPKAYIIPVGDARQRSDAEANRLGPVGPRQRHPPAARRPPTSPGTDRRTPPGPTSC